MFTLFELIVAIIASLVVGVYLGAFIYGAMLHPHMKRLKFEATVLQRQIEAYQREKLKELNSK